MSIESVRRTFVPFFGWLICGTVGGGIVLLLGWLSLSYFFLDRYRLTIEILRMDVPVTCYEGSRRKRLFGLLGRESYRDFVPDHTRIAGYCGVIETDHGWMEIAHTAPLYPFEGKREKLLKMLVPGCRYDVTIFSPFVEPEVRETPVGTNAPPNLIRVRRAHFCDAD